MNYSNPTLCTLKQLCFYFLKLGTIGFGGPGALVQYMERDLVEVRKWITQEEYLEGFALSQLAPGPLATQLAIYLGWVRFKNFGAALCGLAFVLPSFFLCVILSYLYIHFKSLPWIQPLFYTVGATVIGIIVISSAKLAKKAIGKDSVLFTIWFMSAVITAITETENLYFFTASAFLFMFIKNPSLINFSNCLLYTSDAADE